jgi:hypothetical protein
MFRRKKVERPGLTTVRVAQGLLQAEVYKSKLESAGIPVLLEYESIGPALGITVDGLGGRWASPWMAWARCASWYTTNWPPRPGLCWKK